MNKPKVLMLAGNPYFFTKVANEGIEVISKNLQYEEVLAEINSTDATHMVLHDACLNGGAYCKRIEQLRRANESINILLISHNKKPGANIIKAYGEHRIEYLPENTSGLPDKIIQYIWDTTPNVQSVEHDEAQEPVSSSQESVVDTTAKSPKSTTKAKKEVMPKTTEKEQRKSERKEEALQKEPAKVEPNKSSKIEQIETRANQYRQEEEPQPLPVLPERKKLPTRPKPTINVPPSPFKRKEKQNSAAYAAFSVGKLQKPVSATVIPVFSGNSGAGCSWLCVQMATYLHEQGMNCAVTGAKGIMHFAPNHEIDRFELNGINFFFQANILDLVTMQYDYVFVDMGTVMDIQADGTCIMIADRQEWIIECQRAPLKYMVSDYALGRGLALEEIMTNQLPKIRNMAANCTVLLTPRQPDGLAQRLEKRYRRPVFTLPQCEPFTLNNEMRSLLGAILRPTLNLTQNLKQEEHVH